MLLAECVVCLETLESKKVIYASRCGHVLHYECWTECLSTSATCPKCRLPTALGHLIRLYISYAEKEDFSVLQNEIEELRCELSCKAIEFEKLEKQFMIRAIEIARVRREIDRLKTMEGEMMRLTENLNKREREIETLKQAKEETLNIKTDKEEIEKLREQTVELTKVRAELQKFKDQTLELKRVKTELEKFKREAKMPRNRSKEEIDVIRKYQGVVEGLKQCLHEFDQLKKSNQLVKKLKIYTDDIAGDVKTDVKKDPQKYAEMFKEVKKFWNWAGKREEEIKNSPKGCVVHLTGFPPYRKDITKKNIQDRMEYYDAKVAFVTYSRGGKEAFVRLKPRQKCPTDKQNNPADPQKGPSDPEKCLADPQKCPTDPQKCPAELVVSRLTNGKLRIKNFTVNAVVLEGEEEIKFLRRSYDDRDQKLGRVNNDLDYFDDSEEVSMLEYMMNLVAVA